ncbi:MAG TPA: HAMP domain-containing sensor histidine kinase [Verrucomicrobiae bacterium]|jgi:two-component system nitrogen regulation sensor histidine kinase NtrY|nr:HAMP domain-containing sensor histidine kinase [Verrucomicrobiae bacterium]
MSFRTKLFLVFLVTVLASVSLVAYGVTHYTQAAFEESDAQRSEALVSQFNKEYAQRGDEITRQVKDITDADVTLKVAIDLARPNPDLSLYVRDAVGAAQDHGLDFVEFVNWDGTLISSAQYPARVGYKNEWVTSNKNWNDSGFFLRKEELPDGVALSLTVVRVLSGGNDKNMYVVGGRRLDQNFLASLVPPAGTRVLLYRNLEQGFLASALTDVNGSFEQADRLEPLIEQIQKQPQPTVRTIDWTANAEDAESFHAIPLMGRNNELLAVLLLGSSRKELVLLTRHILQIAAVVAGAALLIGLLISLWVSARITRPLEELAEGAREVASGRWDTVIDLRGKDEIGQLASAFNEMTETLAAQRDQLVQTERVAAWRELARRLAHELRNPLFPLQITVENLQKARQLDAKQFLEVFNESTATLKAELANLNTIVGRFNDFSKMPAPHFARVNVNESLRNAVRLFEPQFNAVGKPPVIPEYFLTEPLPEIDADADLLHRAFQNLVLNALDAMPAGGTLTMRTTEHEGKVRIEVSDTGKGLTPEECSRLFTPYYTTKVQGTGLGLAIIQSVISDHHGTISVSSDEGHGTTFRIELPQRQSAHPPAPPEEAPTEKRPPQSFTVAASD